MKRAAAKNGNGKTWLSRVPPDQLQRAVADLGLSTRPQRCLENCTSIAELLGRREDELMTLRGFGASCLTEVRRQLALFTLHQIQPLDGAPADPDAALPLLEAAWSGPAQPRRLSDLLEECVELLLRTGQPLKAAAPHRVTRDASPRLPVDEASLGQVIDHLFAGIGERDRTVVLLRFSGESAEPLAYAEIGRQVGVTRERVRQVYGATMERLTQHAQAQRRKEITRLLVERFRSSGNLLRETEASRVLGDRHAGSETQALALARVLLNVTPAFGQVRDTLWCAEPLRAGETRETMARMRSIVRNAGRWMTRAQVLAELRPNRPAGISEAAAASCLVAHPDLFSPDNHRYGLIEWRSGIPGNLEEALRSLLQSGEPRMAAALTHDLESVLPDGAVPSASQVERVLSAGTPFRRLNGGRYTLIEKHDV